MQTGRVGVVLLLPSVRDGAVRVAIQALEGIGLAHFPSNEPAFFRVPATLEKGEVSAVELLKDEAFAAPRPNLSVCEGTNLAGANKKVLDFANAGEGSKRGFHFGRDVVLLRDRTCCRCACHQRCRGARGVCGRSAASGNRRPKETVVLRLL